MAKKISQVRRKNEKQAQKVGMSENRSLEAPYRRKVRISQNRRNGLISGYGARDRKFERPLKMSRGALMKRDMETAPV